MNTHRIASSFCAAALIGLLAASATGCASARGRMAARNFQRAVTSAAEHVRSSTVTVRTKSREAKSDEGSRTGIFVIQRSSDSGVPSEIAGTVLDDAGRILIPALIKPSETRLMVVIEGEEQEARFLGSDEGLGMTILQGPLAPGARPLDISRPTDPLPGQWMVSVSGGDEASDFEPRIGATLCTGVVYDRYRSFTVADTRFGQIGSPVVDLNGKPIGIQAREGVLSLSDLHGELTALLAEVSTARPDAASAPEDRDRKEGKVRLGILTQPLNSNLARTRGLPARALLVTAVSAKSAAEAAGVRTGDILVGLNGSPLRFRDEALQAWFSRAVRGRADAPFRLSVLREGKPLELEGRLSRMPDAEQMQAHELGFTVADLDNAVRVANNVPPGIQGLLVTEVRRGGPAAVAADDPEGKLRKNDILLELNGQPVPAIADFRRELQRLQEKPSEYVQVKFLRGRVTLYAALSLRQNPTLPPTNGTPR